MKIERFNKINEKLSYDVLDYIESFDESCDDGAIQWIIDVSKNTKLPEYQYALSKDFKDFEKSKSFQESKKLKNVEKYKEVLIEMNNIEREYKRTYNKLVKKEEKLKLEAANEIMYKFQEDLLINDIDSFYKLFLEEEDVNDIEYGETHPNIIKKYKNKINILISTKRYNL